MRSWAWRSQFLATPWPELRAFYEDMASRDAQFGYLIDIVASIEASPNRHLLAAATSMHDLLITDRPVAEPPAEVIRVAAPGSLHPAPDGFVAIEHLSHSGRNDRIERPVADAVPLFWRFVLEKFGIVRDRADLEATWNRIRDHLGRAIDQALAIGVGESALLGVRNDLAHNGLELAADSLADVLEGEDDPLVWACLASAAVEMRLIDRAGRWIARAATYPCPCCGHLVFSEPPGSYAICPLCFWEDDLVQLRWPTYVGGANGPSLIDSQRSAADLGAMEFRFTGLVRGAAQDEPRDPLWRPIDPERDPMEDRTGPSRSWPDDLTTLYWWRPTYWLTRG